MPRLKTALLVAFAIGCAHARSSAADPAPEPPTPKAILASVDRVVSVDGIDQGLAVEIGGIRQWITIRGRDRRNPILLVIHGGPAAPDLPVSYLYERGWEDYFTVVEWDQRGAGKTYLLNDPRIVGPTLTGERMIEDAEELTRYLRHAFDRRKIFVLGHSWGTFIGLQLAQRRPDWLYAYIGAGQIIDFEAQERAGYAWTVGAAKASGNATALAELAALAPYPEVDGSISAAKIDVERKWSIYFGALTYGRRSYDVWENAERLSPDYSDEDFKAIDSGSALSFPRLLPQLVKAKFDNIKKLDCPIIIFAGRHDYTTANEPVQKWFAALDAPFKQWVWFENSAHMMYLEEPGRALVSLVNIALPLSDKPIAGRGRQSGSAHAGQVARSNASTSPAR